MNFRIATVSSVSIPDALNVRRNVRKSVRKGNPSDLARYDYKTLFYDVYNYGDRVVLAGPPLYNLAAHLRAAQFTLDGCDASMLASFADIRRTQRSFILWPQPARWMELTSAIARVTVRIQDADLTTFQNRRVLMTLSKNNELAWIEDWIRFYVTEHDVDAVLIYDNASDQYGLEDILERVRRVKSLKSAIVVNWPYLYGPQSRGIGPFGNFCQATMFEHARRRFLANAAGVINCDVDELVITADGRPIFDHVEESAHGGIRFAGRWVEAIASEDGAERRHRQYDLYDQEAELCATKWAIIPALIDEQCAWRTHWIQDLDLPISPNVLFRHLKGINTNWQYDRNKVVPLRSGRHARDWALRMALERVYGGNEQDSYLARVEEGSRK